MPSSSKKQAHLMSAIDHGWQPPSDMKHAPSKAVAHEFHEADKAQGKWEHAEGGMIVQGLRRVPAGRNFNDHDLHEILGNVNGHAGGGLAHLPVHMMPQLATPHVSPLSSISSEHLGQIAHPTGAFGAHARMPRIPISDTLRNIDAHVQGAKIKMPKIAAGGSTRPHFDDGGSIPRGSSSPGSPGFMGAVRDALAALKNYVIDSPKREMQADRERFENSIVDDNNTAARPPTPENRSDYATGGGVGIPPAGIAAIQQAIKHLQNQDAGSAAATLRNSPHAMAHPDVAAAAHALRAHTGVAPAAKTLQDLKNAHGAAQIPPPFRLGGAVRTRR